MGFAKGLVFGMAMLGAVPCNAQTQTGPQPLSEVDQSAWDAIGQITYGGPVGGAICTGTLIAANLVLTAGHCVAQDGMPMAADGIQFAAGWRAGKSTAVRHGREIVLEMPSAGQPRSLSQDVAVIVLDTPIPADVIRPLPLSRQDLFTETYSVIGYRRDAPDIILRDDSCTLAATQPGVLQLGCGVVSGNSGAPVLMKRHDVWQVAAVMVAAAQGGGDTQSFAVIPGDTLRGRIGAP